MKTLYTLIFTVLLLVGCKNAPTEPEIKDIHNFISEYTLVSLQDSTLTPVLESKFYYEISLQIGWRTFEWGDNKQHLYNRFNYIKTYPMKVMIVAVKRRG